MTPSIVVNPRGTSGAGKTVLIKSLIEKLGVNHRLVRKGTHKIRGYVLKNDTYVMGNYEIICGGADTIKTQDEVCEKVRKAADRYKTVLFEGVLVSDVFGRYLNLSKSLYPRSIYIWGILDTPLDVCIERVLARRKLKGNDKVFDPKKHTIPRFEKVQRGMKNAIREGQLVVLLDHKKADEQMLRIIKHRRFPKDRTYNLDKFKDLGVDYD